MKILVTAGGTGGHIYPALSIIEEFKHQEKNLDIIYVGTKNRMEKDIIPKLGIKYIDIEIYGLTKNIIHDLKDIYLIIKDTKQMEKLIKEFKPDIVLGIGGYVTYPVIKAAYKCHVPIFIHEQNAIPGKVNKLTSKYANLIGVSFKESAKYFPDKNVFYSGNPTSSRALTIPKISKASLNLQEDKKLITMVAGSLGSSSLNNINKEYLKNIANKPYQILYITGKNYYEDFQKESFPSNVKILPYLENLPGILKNTDLLITRAGASTIAEILALQVPSIFIPSPYVANNHQYYNAKSLEQKKLAWLLEEQSLTPQKLEQTIDNCLNNKDEYNLIKNNLKKEPQIR